MERSRHKRELLNRLKSVEGHIRGVQRMVEEGQYCIDILKQTSAIQGAIDKLNVMLLENHLQTCVTTAIRSERQEERERVIRELMDVFHGGSNIGLHWREAAAETCHHVPEHGDANEAAETRFKAGHCVKSD
ncbi:MAG: metal-sensitive transcriptional regulator [Chloroflexota bacterium]|nr:MAG: metal-sensitive transcriptional regulator [Chloroflexota bacterium]